MEFDNVASSLAVETRARTKVSYPGKQEAKWQTSRSSSVLRDNTGALAREIGAVELLVRPARRHSF